MLQNMADTEFEEFRDYFEALPQHIKAPTQCYTLVHDVVLDEESPKEEVCDIGEEEEEEEDYDKQNSQPTSILSDEELHSLNCTDTSRSNHHHHHHHHQSLATTSSEENFGSIDSTSTWTERPSGNERRRRKLPELPKQKKFCQEDTEELSWRYSGKDSGVFARRRRKLPDLPKNCKQISLAEELGDTVALSQNRPHSLLMLKCHSYLRNEDSSPEFDSGNSTAHSPDGPKSTSPQLTLHNGSVTPSSASSSGGLPFTQLELLEATHRGLYKFVPRHRDELEVEIGDPIYVQKEADDLWCEGVNLRSGQQGVFPSAYVVDMEYNDFDPTTPKVKRERFLLGYLGSVETLCHKGNTVLCQAVRKIVSASKDHKPHSCILEVSDQGLRMVDKSKPRPCSAVATPCHDYFYSLKNVSFCGFHPGDHRYLGFITKHPQLQRFACHVFLGCESTRPVAESVGRAFQRFYTKFIETAYPIEDIYIE